MPQIRNRASGALAEVDDGLAERLVAAGTFELVTESKPAVRRGRRPAGDTNTTE
ncbi:DUF7302 family protein [Nocardia abscessus]|uniref:DUF7302 family protein n=1 Tax=Nocardia abscessus TaxID=120957 RepID=UPI003CC7FD78